MPTDVEETPLLKKLFRDWDKVREIWKKQD